MDSTNDYSGPSESAGINMTNFLSELCEIAEITVTDNEMRLHSQSIANNILKVLRENQQKYRVLNEKVQDLCSVYESYSAPSSHQLNKQNITGSGSAQNDQPNGEIEVDSGSKYMGGVQGFYMIPRNNGSASVNPPTSSKVTSRPASHSSSTEVPIIISGSRDNVAMAATVSQNFERNNEFVAPLRAKSPDIVDQLHDEDFQMPDGAHLRKRKYNKQTKKKVIGNEDPSGDLTPTKIRCSTHNRIHTTSRVVSPGSPYACSVRRSVQNNDVQFECERSNVPRFPRPIQLPSIHLGVSPQNEIASNTEVRIKIEKDMDRDSIQVVDLVNDEDEEDLSSNQHSNETQTVSQMHGVEQSGDFVNRNESQLNGFQWYGCSRCDATFNDFDDLRDHTVHYHETDKVEVVCGACREKFGSLKTFNHHRDATHYQPTKIVIVKAESSVDG